MQSKLSSLLSPRTFKFSLFTPKKKFDLSKNNQEIEMQDTPKSKTQKESKKQEITSTPAKPKPILKETRVIDSPDPVDDDDDKIWDEIDHYMVHSDSSPERPRSTKRRSLASEASDSEDNSEPKKKQKVEDISPFDLKALALAKKRKLLEQERKKKKKKAAAIHGKPVQLTPHPKKTITITEVEQPNSNVYSWFRHNYPKATTEYYNKNKKKIIKEHAEKIIEFWWFKARQMRE